MDGSVEKWTILLGRRSGTRRMPSPVEAIMFSGFFEVCRLCSLQRVGRVSSPGATLTVHGGGRRCLVLVVDDDRGVLGQVKTILGPDYDLITAANGSRALEVVRSRPVDVVLLNIQMPALDGLEVLAQVKAMSPRVEVILVSRIVDVPTVVRGVRLGAFDYLTKPFDAVRLRAVIAAASRRGAERILLLGRDAPFLAALKIVLARYVMTATAEPIMDEITQRRGGSPPGLIFFETSAWSEVDIRFVMALRSYCADAALVIMSDAAVAARPWPAHRADATELFIARPCPFDQVVASIVRLLPRWAEASVRVNSQVGKAIDYIVRHYQEPLPAADVARAAGLSVDWLAHRFPSALGMTVKEFVMRLRVELASHLLRTSSLKLEEIAERAGFADASHLSRVFKQCIGIRPGEFRRTVGIGWEVKRAV